jgi:hypothetical protein
MRTYLSSSEADSETCFFFSVKSTRRKAVEFSVTALRMFPAKLWPGCVFVRMRLV